MAVSQNGYSANDRSVIITYTVTASGRRMALRVGPPGEMLADFVRWFDENIRNIDTGLLDDWGYAERPIRGSETLSNHASGTAADVDATQWPLGVSETSYLTAAECAKVRAKLLEYEGCIRWGGDYTGRQDPMHFEINRDYFTVARVWAKIQVSRQVNTVPLATQRAVHLPESQVDGVWGPTTDHRVDLVVAKARDNRFYPSGIDDLQTCVGTTPDGIWGPASQAALVQTLRDLQSVWGATVDGAWGPNTESRYIANRTRYYKP
jgi:hypothetical protein